MPGWRGVSCRWCGVQLGVECDDLSVLRACVQVHVPVWACQSLEPDHEVCVWGWANRGYNPVRTILFLRPEAWGGVSVVRILVSGLKLRGSETGVGNIIIAWHRRKLTTVSAVCILIFSVGDSTMLFNATHGADTQSRSARQEVLVYGRLNFK